MLGLAGGFVCFLFVIPSLAAAYAGHTALRQIKKSPERYGGRKLALTGLVTAYLGVALLVAKVVAVVAFGAALVFGAEKALDQIP